MLYALLASLPWAALHGFVLWSHERERRERHAALVAEREEWRELERHLLGRIQAPAAAEKQAAIDIAEHPEEKPYVSWDNDEEWHEAQTKVMNVGS